MPCIICCPSTTLFRSLCIFMPDPRVVLVTGASSGFGLETAVLLSQRGFRVFGTSRRHGSPVATEEPPSLRSEEHTSELQSRGHLVCRLLPEKKKTCRT